MIPPDADGEFVANMEEVLETYEKAYDPECPVVCMDEQPVQLIGETRVPIPATKEHPERVDYEYERKGTASIFMFAEPLTGLRQARPLAEPRPAHHAFFPPHRLLLGVLSQQKRTPGTQTMAVVRRQKPRTRGWASAVRSRGPGLRRAGAQSATMSIFALLDSVLAGVPCAIRSPF